MLITMKLGLNVIMAVIGIVIAISMLATVSTAITAANLTGINATIAAFIPLGLIVGCLLLAFKTGGNK